MIMDLQKCFNEQKQQVEQQEQYIQKLQQRCDFLEKAKSNYEDKLQNLKGQHQKNLLQQQQEQSLIQ